MKNTNKNTLNSLKNRSNLKEKEERIYKTILKLKTLLILENRKE